MVGPTHDFPRGKFNDHDEGGLEVGLTVQDKTIIINFGTPVAWFGLPKDQALAFAAAIIKHANTIG